MENLFLAHGSIEPHMHLGREILSLMPFVMLSLLGIGAFLYFFKKKKV
ncbi:MAG: QVPTGV class sortase B protein-sorting domain-containing protein [Leptospiraceae bacterium]|nr:QVPTGV class sortase B protein-sorting domain-containing protein [Leptospiraceae bacterium]MCP5500310.1 QVPTGV class sortase B protein-sorting domain-containing protein [Leptospiraceae bacterium]